MAFAGEIPEKYDLVKLIELSMQVQGEAMKLNLNVEAGMEKGMEIVGRAQELAMNIQNQLLSSEQFANNTAEL